MRVITDNKAGTSTSSLLVEDDAPGYTDLLQEREILIRRIAELEKEKMEAILDRLLIERSGLLNRIN